MKKKIIILSSILVSLVIAIMFLIVIIFASLFGNSSTNTGTGTITKQSTPAAYYYNGYKELVKIHLSIKKSSVVKGYVTPSRTILFYSILMDNYCHNLIKDNALNPSMPAICKKYDSIYHESFFADRYYGSITDPMGSNSIDEEYAKLIQQNDPIALAKFRLAYELNLDETSRMLSISEACQKLAQNVGEDYCSAPNIKSYIDNLIAENYESDSSPMTIFSYPLGYGVGQVTSLFNVERNISGANGVSSKGTHSGWDIAAPAMSKVYSVCSGTVTSINNSMKQNVSGGATNYVIIQCDETVKEGEEQLNIEVRYWHLYPDSITVSKGDHVKQNEHIAGVGTTGNSTGNHLHLQVNIANNSGRKLDAFYYIDWTSYFAKYNKDHETDVEIEPPEEEDEDESTSFDDELNENSSENN